LLSLARDKSASTINAIIAKHSSALLFQLHFTKRIMAQCLKVFSARL